MVEVRYRDRLGNNLFQYALGRIIAEELGFALKASPIDGFPRTSDKVEGATHDSPEEKLEGHRIDFSGILSNSSARRVILDGWFQRHEYYTPYRERIQEWFRLAPEHTAACEADLVVNVRRTDYISLGWALPFSYYEEAIERALPPGGKLTIVTDDPEDWFFRNFRRWRPTFFRGTALQQMSFMSHAPRLVMSASTFSWWPAFLGNPEAVVCPEPQFGPWAPESEHEVNLIEHDRFICIRAANRYESDLVARLHMRARSYRQRIRNWMGPILGSSSH